MANLTFLIMDPPHESATSTTALRIIDAAIRKGHNVHVMAYEGATATTYTTQKTHAKEWVAALLEAAAARGVKLDWMRSALDEEERGYHQAQLSGTRRGSPVDFYKEQVLASDNVLIIPTR
jgi:sulfur relay (sulfurtransferase) complex TusBCD TusD component (DsrE family)